MNIPVNSMQMGGLKPCSYRVIGRNLNCHIRCMTEREEDNIITILKIVPTCNSRLALCIASPLVACSTRPVEVASFKVLRQGRVLDSEAGKVARRGA